MADLSQNTLDGSRPFRSYPLTPQHGAIPLVNGTMQYVHILLQPLIILIHPLTLPSSICTGNISAYVSSTLNITFPTPPPSPASPLLANNPGKSLYASGP